MVVADNISIINGLQVTEITIVNMPKTRGVGMEATYALLQADPKTKTVLNTHGKCSANMSNWSEDTLKILTSLIESMENDLLPKHFTETNNNNAEETKNESRTRSEPSEQREEPHQV
jgi:hypothetical protein